MEPTFDRSVWSKRWHYRAAELALFEPIVGQLWEHCYVPDLVDARSLNARFFLKQEELERLQGSERKLKNRKSSVAELYRLIEPAAIFHELWFYQLNLSKDTTPKAKRVYRDFHRPVRAILAADSPFGPRLKKLVAKEFESNTASRTGLPWLRLDWTPEQEKFLVQQMGSAALEGKQSRRRTRKGWAYIMHKAPYWRMAFKVLMDHLTKDKHLKKYDAAQITYSFVRLVFPDVIPRLQTARQRWDFIRLRIKYTPKIGSRL
ncbi:MAG: hypothetical protein ACHQ2Z_03445 [Elusimicrobiota bacterium]